MPISTLRALATAALLPLLLLGVAIQSPAARPAPIPPPFGANVFVFTPTMSAATMQATIDRIYAAQAHSEFGAGRYAFLLQPGEYHLDVPIGFYTQVLGLGSSPDQTHITGNVHVDAASRNNNATTTFWRTAEGFSVTPTDGALQWAVSQAVSFRRMHVLGDMVLHQRRGWASGGWMSDTQIDGTVDSGSQQQWISRNTEWKSWTGSNWNMVFVGARNAPVGEWPTSPYTKVETTPIVREKPFLELDPRGRYTVRVPALTHNTAGVTWHLGTTPGRSVPLSRFYIAHPETDTATTINAALAHGKSLLLTPGTYDLTQPLRVTRKNAIVLGLGFATLHPIRGTAAMLVADADGISVAGLLFDAGQSKSPSLLEVGVPGSTRRHERNPIALHDLFFRVGGAAVGRVSANLILNSNDTLVDHTWIWRADHGSGVGWTSNTSDNGLIVNGDHVSIYGLFVEHHQQYQVLWKGNFGRTFFYQSEIPYDPPTQALWKDPSGDKGWASYKVDERITSHEAWGLGIYSVFRHPDVVLAHAIATPLAPNIHFHHMITVALDNLGAIENVIDDTGGPTQIKPRVNPKVTNFP